MSSVAIEISAVTKSYGKGREVPVLDNVSVQFVAGEFVSLMGPSGSGKTTLLNLIAGLDQPESGSITVNAQRLSHLSDRQLSAMRLRTIGFVFQSFNLLPELSVAENISWPLEFSRHSRAEVRQRTSEALQLVGMHDVGHRYPGELSGGEQQRAAIARAIATRPSILLADEPTGNLDSHTGEKILDLLRLLNATQLVTVVMVTHNALAATYGQRTLELRDGRIIRDVRARPEAKLAVIHTER